MKKLILSLLAGTAMLATQAQAEPIQITADPGTPLCTNFLGFGVQWSAYPWFDLTEAAWQKIFERLDYMRVPIVRLMTRSYTYCDGFDADGKLLRSAAALQPGFTFGAGSLGSGWMNSRRPSGSSIAGAIGWVSLLPSAQRRYNSHRP